MDISNQDFVPFQPTYTYHKSATINVCCKLLYNAHTTWLRHCKEKHAHLEKVYLCGKCKKPCKSIASVSVHYGRCKSSLPTRDTTPIVPEASTETHDLFSCEWCDFSCATKIGLGVHKRSKHPADFESTKDITRVKLQWSDEELAVLASAEAQLPEGTRFVNQALLPMFPDRSLEAIKGARNKNKRYKPILSSIKERMASNPPVRRLPATPQCDSIPSTPRRNVVTEEIASTPQGRSIPLCTPRRTLPLAPDPESPEPELDIPSIDPFITSIRSTYHCNEELKLLIEKCFEDEIDLETFDQFIRATFFQSPKSNKRQGNSDTRRYRRKIKLKRYARYQQMFRRNAKNLADMIINGKEESNTYPSVESIKDTYQNLYESTSPLDDVPVDIKKISGSTYYPITGNELNIHLKCMKSSAPGIDNFTIQDIRKLDINLILTLLNFQLWALKQFPIWKENKTILIPKTNDDLLVASNWRPITLTPMMVRLLHRIIASRISSATNLNIRQKAFTPVDGCAHNTLILDTLITDARKRHKNLNIVGIDLSKAFDTVSIHSIRRALERHSFEEPMIKYIIDAYSGATTTIKCGDNTVENVKLNRGVKQGDPLSPNLFNLVLDELIDELPPEIGVAIGEAKVNCLAFADDIILISESKVGMESLLRITETFFKARSMSINAKKCFSMCLTTTVRNRAPYVVKQPMFNISNVPIVPTDYDGFFKYLGVKFNPHGKMAPNLKTFQAMLRNVKKSPLKPYQKLELVRTYVCAKVLHEMVLGRVTKGLLLSYDAAVRECLRDILQLPKDIPIAFFYAKVKEGGLGLPSFINQVPKTLLRRLDNLSSSADPVIVDLVNHSSTTALISKCLSILEFETKEEALKSPNPWAKDLYSKIDGCPLLEFKANPSGQLWLTGRTTIVTGKRFRDLVKLRIGRLPTLENSNRGREADKKCRKCRRVNESLQHVVQHCHFTHFDRMQRHDSIAQVIFNKCIEKGDNCLWEPVFQLEGKKMKPDLVIASGDQVAVVDISIVTENMRFQHSKYPSTLEGAWLFKANYYNDVQLVERLKEQFGQEKQLYFGAIIISLRGIWCTKNDDTLKKIGVATGIKELLVVRCMEKSVLTYKHFMHSVH